MTLVGPLYLNLTLNYIYLLHLERGPVYIFFLVVVIVFGDTGAYFVGKFWGKRKMAPKASPRKTWEGSLGGISCAVLGGLIFHLVLIRNNPLWIMLALAFSLHVVAQIGDLLESLFKRAAGKKDSSNVLGGHGGFLDRVDSFILAAPYFYFILLAVGLG